MVQLETFLTELSSESQLSAKTFQDLFQVGKTQSLSVDMLMQINTMQLMQLWTSLVNSLLNSFLMMDQSKMPSKQLLITSRVLAALWECTTQPIQLKPLPELASTMLLIEDILWNSRPRTLSWRNMMDSLRIFSKKCTRHNSRNSTRQRVLTTNTDWLMIWLLKSSSQMVVLYGLAKTMMVMSKVISLLKDMVHWVSWLQCS